MRLRTQRQAQRGIERMQARRRRPCVADATIAPDPGPPPEAVFDRITGPYGGPYGERTGGPHGHRAALALLGAFEHDEET
jgi:hypothetical protein